MRLAFLVVIVSGNEGNYFNKYESRNPLIRIALSRFMKDLRRFVSSLNPDNVLDVGCGEGYIASYIKSSFPEIDMVCSDISKECVKKARSACSNMGFAISDGRSLGFRSKSFDLVICLEVLEHLERPEKVVKELRRVSRKGVIVSVPNEPLWRISNIARLAYLKDMGNTPGHIQHFNKNKLGTLLERHFKKIVVKKSSVWLFALCEL